MSDEYRLAYERQKLAREKSEKLLEDKSRELYQSTFHLKEAYEKLKQQKLQLIHQEKLASIGQLSAGVAHEINNPIGYVSNNLEALKKYTRILTDFISNIESVKSLDELLVKKEALDIGFIIEDIDELVEDCLEGTSRVTQIVKSLKNFSRNDADTNEVFLINDCINSTLKLVQSEVKYTANIVKDLDGNPEVIGGIGNLGQVILNLIMNGVQAIEAKKEKDPDLLGELKIHTKINKDQVSIVIQDNGGGIDEEYIKQIFDPFFTTKAVGEGTGLGLSISESIVKKMGGSLVLDTQIGVGTSFSITLMMHHK